jgi:hypothetical protein
MIYYLQNDTELHGYAGVGHRHTALLYRNITVYKFVKGQFSIE